MRKNVWVFWSLCVTTIMSTIEKSQACAGVADASSTYTIERKEIEDGVVSFSILRDHKGVIIDDNDGFAQAVIASRFLRFEVAKKGNDARPQVVAELRKMIVEGLSRSAKTYSEDPRFKTFVRQLNNKKIEIEGDAVLDNDDLSNLENFFTGDFLSTDGNNKLIPSYQTKCVTMIKSQMPCHGGEEKPIVQAAPNPVLEPTPKGICASTDFVLGPNQSAPVVELRLQESESTPRHNSSTLQF